MMEGRVSAAPFDRGEAVGRVGHHLPSGEEGIVAHRLHVRRYGGPEEDEEAQAQCDRPAPAYGASE